MIKHDCAGGCQGCSDCPFARPFHDETAPTEITRWMMVKYVIECIYGHFRVKWFFWRHKVEIGEIVDKYLKEKENKNEVQKETSSD